jgi:hypothetical protein
VSAVIKLNVNDFEAEYSKDLLTTRKSDLARPTVLSKRSKKSAFDSNSSKKLRSAQNLNPYHQFYEAQKIMLSENLSEIQR